MIFFIFLHTDKRVKNNKIYEICIFFKNITFISLIINWIAKKVNGSQLGCIRRVGRGSYLLVDIKGPTNQRNIYEYLYYNIIALC